MIRRRRAVAAALAVALVAPACGGVGERVLPACDDVARLAIVAQSVPDAAYVPCIAVLPPGWSFEGIDVADDGTTLRLESDRSDRPVRIRLRDRCDTRTATPVAPEDQGVRTFQEVEAIDPRVVGRVLDAFPGGCVVTSYDFPRGRHVALVAELGQAVALRSRIELAQELRARLGITLDP